MLQEVRLAAILACRFADAKRRSTYTIRKSAVVTASAVFKKSAMSTAAPPFVPSASNRVEGRQCRHRYRRERFPSAVVGTGLVPAMKVVPATSTSPGVKPPPKPADENASVSSAATNRLMLLGYTGHFSAKFSVPAAKRLAGPHASITVFFGAASASDDMVPTRRRGEGAVRAEER
jgi:hypothetical protein